MMSAILLGLAGVIWLLGVVTLLLAGQKDHGWVVSGFVMLNFVACAMLAGTLAMGALR
jgi:hypothetical protein